MNGSNCPYCANRRVLEGFNDLASKMPELAKQWHRTKNIDKDGNHIFANEIA